MPNIQIILLIIIAFLLFLNLGPRPQKDTELVLKALSFVLLACEDKKAVAHILISKNGVSIDYYPEDVPTEDVPDES